MKKRMLLILAFGLSFTPAVFAAEMKFNDTPATAIACNAKVDKTVPSSAQGNGSAPASGAGGAGSASGI